MQYIALFLAIVLICFGVALVIGYYEGNKLRIKEYRIENKKNKGNGRLRIAMISDLHNNSFKGGYSAVYDAILGYDPDIICIAGDMVVCRSYMRDENLRSGELVAELSKRKKIYYGMGNHELGLKRGLHESGDCWTEYRDIISRGNVELLDNESALIEIGGNSYRIYGLSISSEYYRRLNNKKPDKAYIEELLGTKDDDAFNILIAHNPDFFDAYEKWGAELVLSGHNHGGLVRLPLLGGVLSPRLHLFPHFDYGQYKRNSTTMIVSNGMGSHSIKIRVNNIPELQIIDIV